MKKGKIITLLSLSILGGALLTKGMISKTYCAEEVVEEAEQSVEEKELLDKIKENQILSQLIGTLCGGVGSMLVSGAFMLVNRDTTKKSLVAIKEGNRNVKEGFSKTTEIILSNDKVVNKMKEYESEVKNLIVECRNLSLQNAKLEESNKRLEEVRQAEVDGLLAIISSSPELVANGTAEKLNKIYKK